MLKIKDIQDSKDYAKSNLDDGQHLRFDAIRFTFLLKRSYPLRYPLRHYDKYRDPHDPPYNITTHIAAPTIFPQCESMHRADATNRIRALRARANRLRALREREREIERSTTLRWRYAVPKTYIQTKTDM